MAASSPFRVPELGRAWPFLPPVLVGVFLRLWELSGQIPLDDEWHSLNFVQDKSFLEVLGTHGIGANCIPQNLINWLWLHAGGWTEMRLFLPSVLCGVAGLLLFPVLVARLAGRAVALLFAWLLAISPCLVFYSRIVRPYSMVLFFGFSALTCLALWTREGKSRWLLAYAVSGFVAIYFHLYAALPLLAALGALGLLVLFGPRRRADAPWISARAPIGAGLLLAGLVLVFLGPAHVRNPWWLHAQGVSRVTATGLREFLSLLAGTRFAASKLAFGALAAWGLREWFRKDLRIGALFAAAWVAYFGWLAIATQDGMHAAIQLARYGIILFPLAMLQAATALEELLAGGFPRLAPGPRTMLGLLAIAGLLAGSPLWRTCKTPSNFMHHSAFQDSYAAFDDSRSRLRQLTPFPQMPRERLHAFYFSAEAATAPGLVEYPMYVGDAFNLHWYAQHFHRRPVAIGYVPDVSFPPLPYGNEFTYGAAPLDHVFGRIGALGWTGRLRFRNLVSLADPDRLRRDFPGWLLVVHRDVLRETLELESATVEFIPPPGLAAQLTDAFGAPVLSDDRLMVWRIR